MGLRGRQGGREEGGGGVLMECRNVGGYLLIGGCFFEMWHTVLRLSNSVSVGGGGGGGGGP